MGERDREENKWKGSGHGFSGWNAYSGGAMLRWRCKGNLRCRVVRARVHKREVSFDRSYRFALGGVPVAMPMPERYDALQKGVADGAVHPIEANKGWKMAEVTKFTTLDY